jgi:hypothetical protein
MKDEDDKGCWKKHDQPSRLEDCPARMLFRRVFREDALDELMPYCNDLKVAQKECSVFPFIIGNHYCNLMMEELGWGYHEESFGGNIKHYLKDIEKLKEKDLGRCLQEKYQSYYGTYHRCDCDQCSHEKDNLENNVSEALGFFFASS